jgi:hypothetical protein
MRDPQREIPEWQPAGRSTRWYEWLLILLLLSLAGGVRAESVFKCADADGAVAYQSQPCAAAQHESTIAIAPAPAYAKSPEYAVDRAAPTHERALASRRESQAMSYECRTADGQVFYRHSACPHSVPANASSSGSSVHHGSRGGSGAGAMVAVSSRRVPRDEACSQMQRAGAIGRAGHAHDEEISTYDRDLGRDPCR